MGITIGLALLLLALLAVIWAVRLRSAAGLPWAPVIGQDTLGRELERPLIARRLGLSGKPDYLLDMRGYVIPVEVKPGRRAARPYESDLLQLAAYCLLVEETHDAAPPYGLLRYAEQTFRLNYTDTVRAEVIALIDEMRGALEEELECGRSHDDRFRCAGCGFFEQCDQALLEDDE
jgi:CRISPR-associated exonuclease Cas4